jgi:glycosyltransferase involved in cell wall biosynthesis
MNKKQILFFHPNLSSGGAERVMIHMVNNFDRSKFDISLLLADKSGKFLQDIKDDIPIYGLNVKRLRLSGIVKLYFFVWKKKPDIIFSNYTRYNAAVIFLKLFWQKKMKIVIRETGVPTSNYFKNKPYILWLYKLFINNANLIIAQSTDMYNGILKIYKANPNIIKKINNPVDFALIDKKIVENKFVNLPTNKINILAVGWLTYQKGFDLLIERFAELADISKYHITILGVGEQENYLKKLAKEKGVFESISFLGFEKNPYIYMKKADIFISCSRHEGFPNAVIEALACGKPVITNSYKGGINEIIITGKNGLFFNIYEKKSLEKVLDNYSNTKFWTDKDISTDCFMRWNKDKIIKEYEQAIIEYAFN